jgi:hypothetical protein
MSGTPIIPPVGYEFSDGPRKRYVEQYASSLVLNNYLRVGLISASVAVVSLVYLNVRTNQALRSFKPLVAFAWYRKPVPLSPPVAALTSMYQTIASARGSTATRTELL